MSTEIKLGLGNPPEPIYLYIKNAELAGESYLWYNYDINNRQTIPVQQKALTGYLLELRLTTKEFKGKDNIKLDIVVRADELYVIRTGVETYFAKTFLLAASVVQNLSKPLIIAATAGEQSIVFCRLYDAENKTRFSCEWNPNADWAALIQRIQSKLSFVPQQDIISSFQPLPDSPQSPVHPQDLRVKHIRTLLDYPVDLVKEWLQFQDVDRPSQLPTESVDELIKTMCLAWAADKVDHRDDAVTSYQQLRSAIASGAEEVAAINAWMQQLEARRSLLPMAVSLPKGKR